MSLEILTIYVLAFGPLIGLAIGVTYFVKAPSDATFGLRLLTSAFGLSMVPLWVLVGGPFWPDHLRYNDAGLQALYWLQLVPLLLLVLAVAMYPGNRKLHLLLVPLGLLAWAGTFGWGWVFVHGK